MIQPGDLVQLLNNQMIGLVISKNKAKKRWHKKLTIMLSDGSLKTVSYELCLEVFRKI